MINTVIFDLLGVVLNNGKLNTELLEFLDTVKNNLSLYVFTSLDPGSDPVLIDQLKKTFLEVYSIYDVGLSKEDPVAFAKLLDLLGVKPEETLFIDDNQMNIAAAQKAGLRTVLFIGNQELYEQFGKFHFSL